MMRKSKIEKALRKSPINYFSDLFIITMVVAWIAVLIIMVIMAIYATIILSDTGVWCYVYELTGIPLTAGGVVYLIKCTAQHAIANNHGMEAKKDFPNDESEEAG